MYGLTSKVGHASLLATGAAIRFTQKDDPKAGYTALTLSLPDSAPDPNDSVIVLDVPGKITVDPSLEQQPDGAVTLPPLVRKCISPKVPKCVWTHAASPSGG